MSNEPKWERITDPEKIFHLQKAGWEIEVTAGTVWVPWDVKVWNSSWSFRARPPKPKMKQVKLLAYLGDIYLHLVREDVPLPEGIRWTRQPHLDKIAEVLE